MKVYYGLFAPTKYLLLSNNTVKNESMKQILNPGWILVAVLLFVASCNTHRDYNANSDKYDPAKTYKLQLKPTPGAVYKYEIIIETGTELSVNDKKANMLNKAEMDII